METAMKRVLAGMLILSLAFAGMAQAAPTLILPEQLAQPAPARDADADRALVLATLERDGIQQRMRDLGVDPAEAGRRVAALSDDEVSRLAGEIERAPAGGTDVLGFVLVIFLVLLFTDILGFTKVFPFVKHGSGRAR
jgi:hypothetical protein